MQIKRRSFRLFILWLVIVFLLGINVGVFTTDLQTREHFQTLVQQYEQQQVKELTQKQYQLHFYNEVFAEVEPFTPQQQETIDFINSGYEYTTSTFNEPDCSEYEKPWRHFTGGGNCGFVLTNATGHMRMLIVEFASPNFDVSASQNKIHFNTLHDADSLVVRGDVTSPSYQYLSTFYDQQSLKFGAKDFSLS
ncbi:hypothetical protein GW793_03760 [bacterium]|uniref:Uncharacterized protein n=2 Tax=Katanobacteria TaxID=422282 RepID=A0A2M7X3L4_UNCKA|nr:hypothetical protein [bacterium]PIP56675.1 MAG: hypothetical protein COX05_01855 [candidate division WWE3 bacterium CG22_combo_CG10-13_8_21_14_all_39_12]PJA40762.1 MAG: hypothetical protein CO179_01450 [candidate division WWE3 bacterium CG_4_9_14_3_um_filter_39_7]